LLLVYIATTDNIIVTVDPEFLPMHSNVYMRHWVWAYHISIENLSESPVRLVRRYWHITDALGRVSEVEGEGVVGEQPLLQPGDIFTYSSGCPLNTPSGIMRGQYEMLDAKGKHFSVTIPSFSLDSPNAKRVFH
jgi:ApaG protein